MSLIFTDGTRMVGSTREKLHAFAESLGIKLKHFHEHPIHPYYDLLKTKKKKAFAKGVELVSPRALVTFCKIMYAPLEKKTIKLHPLQKLGS